MADQILRLAHRGDWRRAPENTIAAFTAALAVPACDGLEFDVRVSADGVPVISHDATLLRVFGRPDRVDSLTAAQLGAIGVPSLADVLAAVGRRAFLDVEVKDDPGPSLVEVLVAGRGPRLSRAVVSSFDPAVLERIGRIAPRWRRWLISHRLDPSVVGTARELGCEAVAARFRALDPDSVALAREAGLDVVTWTVRSRRTFDRVASLGVVAVAVEGLALDG